MGHICPVGYYAVNWVQESCTRRAAPDMSLAPAGVRIVEDKRESMMPTSDEFVRTYNLNSTSPVN